MEGHQIGTTRTEQDAIVNAANDCSIIGITGWRIDVPGGRLITIQIDEHTLYETAFVYTAAILTVRLHRVKRIPDTRLQDEIRDHAAAMATQFVRCCYQQMRESAKARYSTIVRDRMLTNLRITRCHLPTVFARIVAGFGPITVSEGHLKTTHLVPYIDPGNGDMNHDAADLDHPWNEDIQQFHTCLASFRINPEVRVSDVDFTNTIGSAFWTVWAATPDNLQRFTGFCPLPESCYTEVDKLLASLIKEPLYTWPRTPIVPIDWSDNEVDRPAAWNTYGVGSLLYGVSVHTAGLEFTGPRHFYMPAELICARVTRHVDHDIRMIRPPPKEKPASPISKRTRQTIKGKGSSAISATSENGTEFDLDDPNQEVLSLITKGASSKQTAPPPPQQDEPLQATLRAIWIYKVRVGYAGFQGIAYEGVDASVANANFTKASNLS